MESARALAWAEFERHASIGRKYLHSLEEEFSEELARCLDPEVHERQIRPYGAIVCREVPDLRHLGRVLETDGLAPELVRSFADGSRTFMLIVKDAAPQLVCLHEALDTDQDYAAAGAWIEGLIVSNDHRGVVRIATDNSITLVEGRRWFAKDLVFEAAEEVIRVVPAADPTVVRRLLELCHYRISPAKYGATLLYLLIERADSHLYRNAGIPVEGLGLSVCRETDEALILHQARYRDGALVIRHDGTLLQVNVFFRPSRSAEREIPPLSGTRHTSASRHTFDCPDVLAFVVSADGPVTVLSDGKPITELKMGDALLPKYHPDATETIRDTSCPSCGVSLSILTIRVPGYTETERALCPACGRTAAEESCWQVHAFMRKTIQSIEALLELRRGSAAPSGVWERPGPACRP